MHIKKYILAFIYSFMISILAFLFIDLRSDWQRLIGMSILIAVISTLFLLNFEKPIRKWYRENYDKSYTYRKIKPVIKDRKINQAGP